MPKLKDITVWQQIYDPHADGYMVAGKLKDSASAKPFIMGWRSRRGQKLIEPQTFKSKGWLTRSFRDALVNDDWPYEKLFHRDTQQQRLYEWEWQYLDPHSPRISEKKAREIIRRVSTDYNMEPPVLRWRTEDTDDSYYLSDEHSITFHHRDLISLLHELGHAIHDQSEENDKGAHHSPAFARIILELYNRYADFPLDYLFITANKCNLLGDIQSEQLIFDPSKHRP